MATISSARPMDYSVFLDPQVSAEESRKEIHLRNLYSGSAPDMNRLVSLVFDNSCDDAVEAEMDNFIEIIGSGLEKVAAINKCFAGEQDALSKFSCAVEPQIPLVDYLFRLTTYLEAWKPSKGKTASARALILSLVYLERVYRLHPGARISSKSVHKILLVSMLVAVKFVEDQPLSNNYWSKVGGINLKELNRLEAEFCNLIGFEFHVSQAELSSSTLRCCVLQARK
mmetsp:Transcript_16134/g.18284  ORF Transcript_16134/g.18284 Transcript_16134/m.18284 type:complete len:227 (+) Transcript_16134:110-790(+)